METVHRNESGAESIDTVVKEMNDGGRVIDTGSDMSQKR